MVRQLFSGGGCVALAWHVIQTASRFWAADRALKHLHMLDLRTFFPLALTRDDHGSDHTRPYFGSYRFVEFDPRTYPWGEIARQPGVARLILSAPGRPATVPSPFVEALLFRATAAGVIDLRPGPQESLVGRVVEITDGPLATYRGICDQHEDGRVRVLLSLFGRDTPIPVPRAAVRVVTDAATA